jgi:hypothetical protein
VRRAVVLAVLCACGSASPDAAAPPSPSADPIGHVVVGPMTPDDPSLAHVSEDMRAAAVEALLDDGRFVVGETGPGDAYYLDGNLSDYSVDGGSQLRCTVHLVVATHPDHSILAMPDGAATTGVGADLEPAQRACAGEVVRALVRGTVIPYLAARVSG